MQDAFGYNITLSPLALFADFEVFGGEAFDQCGGPQRVDGNVGVGYLSRQIHGCELHDVLGHFVGYVSLDEENSNGWSHDDIVAEVGAPHMRQRLTDVIELGSLFSQVYQVIAKHVRFTLRPYISPLFHTRYSERPTMLIVASIMSWTFCSSRKSHLNGSAYTPRSCSYSTTGFILLYNVPMF